MADRRAVAAREILQGGELIPRDACAKLHEPDRPGQHPFRTQRPSISVTSNAAFAIPSLTIILKLALALECKVATLVSVFDKGIWRGFSHIEPGSLSCELNSTVACSHAALPHLTQTVPALSFDESALSTFKDVAYRAPDLRLFQ
jgi:hypothetical protein